MRKILWSSLLFFCGTLLNACQPGNRLPVVVITTSAGEITATIDTVRAPISGANFMKLVDAGAYDTGATFYRVVRPDNQPDNDVKIDYFAVSLPDLLIWEDDLNRRNKVHCHYMMGLGYLGLGDSENAEKHLKAAQALDINHQGVQCHMAMLS